MFHWICPECGREIAPTIRECPACDPVAATVETALAGEVEAPARAGKEAAAPAMSSPLAGTQPDPTPNAFRRAGDEGRPDTTADYAPDHAGADTTAPENAAAPQQLSGPAPPALAGASTARRRRSSQTAPGGYGRARCCRNSALPPRAAIRWVICPRWWTRCEPEPPPSREPLPLPMRAPPRVPASLRAFIAELRPAGAEPRIPS